MRDPVIDAIVEAAVQVPEEHILAAASAIVDAPRWSIESEAKLINATPALNSRNHAQRISKIWASTPDLPGIAIAAALRASAATGEALRTENQTSLVWTGPQTQVAGLRTTRAVLASMVKNATESLVLVSFTTHDVSELVSNLASAIARGVKVTLILETPNDPGGPLTIGSGHSFAPIRDSAGFYRWPLETREAFFASTARLHAKCVIADRSTALITSANLTSAGINDNIELGVLIESGPLPIKLSCHVEQLIENQTLEPVSSVD